ncbi:hypothetical protein SAMN06296429_10541 [Janibacter indicus]|uniref:Uncharacterized protein n=1 Tax=Janibacter indicus TaxID=857417 RepID=A0A1W2A371_9MICO|nr:hypothetical protein SAMN06296429_10541 [Janibacter indicus]
MSTTVTTAPRSLRPALRRHVDLLRVNSALCR